MDAADVINKIFALALGVSVHESAHAWAALKCGDDSAAREGRISLNPVDHVDPVGTLLVPFVLVMSGAPFLFGWAKPVVYYPSRVRDPRLAERWISFAGPLANILLAVLLAMIFRTLRGTGALDALTAETARTLVSLLIVCIVTNLGLALFNLVPVPPLDGFGVAKSFLSYEQSMRLELFARQYGFMLLILLLWLDAFRFLDHLMRPLLAFLLF